MKKLIIRFITCKSFISAAIREVTFSRLSHVEFGTETGTWIGAHLDGGVEERPADYCDKDLSLEYVYEIPVPDVIYDAIMADVRSNIGAKYYLKDIFGLLLHINVGMSHEFICSMFVYIMLFKHFTNDLRKQLLNVLPEFANLVTPEILHLAPLFMGNRVKYFNAKETK